ncbi:MAG: aldose 1-epimerase [Maribacter sp.]
MESLKSGNQSVRMDAGELVSYLVDGHEFMHQKGNPGWRNVDTEMFPIIGPTNEANFRVTTPRGIAIQDQHGLLREMEYTLVEETERTLGYSKTYTANTKIKNGKYPNKSDEQYLTWPYDFEFKKVVEISDAGLNITFTIMGDHGMPFMLGYHPAFMLHDEHATIVAGEQTITIPTVMAVGSRAYEVPHRTSMLLKDKKSLNITTKGFESFMLWTEVPNMVCIEPITFYPYAVPQTELAEGFKQLSDGPRSFEVMLSPV